MQIAYTQSSSKISSRIILFSAIALLILSLVVHALVGYTPLNSEDALITYRVSANLAKGQGPVFNPGQHVESYTNHLWMVLVAAIIISGLDPIIAAPVLGGLFFVGAMVLAYLLLPRRQRWVLLLIALESHFSYWILSGMETPMLIFWSMFFYFLLMKERPVLAGIAAAMIAMTRFDGLVLMALIALFFTAMQWNLKKTIREYIPTLAVFTAIYLPFFLFRWHYYGHIYPNTYYAKTVIPLDYNLTFGAKYLLEFLKCAYPPLIGAAVALFFWFRNSSYTALHKLALLSPFLCWVLYVFWVGGDTLSMGVRFFLPLIFALFLVISTIPSRQWATAFAIFLASALIIQAGIGIINSLDYLAKSLPGGYRIVGLKMRSALPKGATMAVQAIGNIGYFSEMPIIDLLGLADEQVAREGLLTAKRFGKGHVKTGFQIALERRPEFFWFQQIVPLDTDLSALPFPSGCPRMREMLLSREFADNYRPVKLKIADNKAAILFERKDLHPDSP